MFKSHHHLLLHADGSIAQNVWADLMKMSIDFNHFRLQLYSSSSSELTSQKFIDGTIFLTLQNFFFTFYSMAELIAHHHSSLRDHHRRQQKIDFLSWIFFWGWKKQKKIVKKYQIGNSCISISGEEGKTSF